MSACMLVHIECSRNSYREKYINRLSEIEKTTKASMAVVSVVCLLAAIWSVFEASFKPGVSHQGHGHFMTSVSSFNRKTMNIYKKKNKYLDT